MKSTKLIVEKQAVRKMVADIPKDLHYPEEGDDQTTIGCGKVILEAKPKRYKTTKCNVTR